MLNWQSNSGKNLPVTPTENVIICVSTSVLPLIGAFCTINANKLALSYKILFLT